MTAPNDAPRYAYKVLDKGRRAFHGGSGVWPAPPRWKVLRTKGPIVLCEPGTLHLCRKEDLVSWLGPEIWLAEYDGLMVAGENKIGVRRTRLVKRFTNWNERTARLFACWCAEQALALVKKPDPRSVEAIKVARLFADNKKTRANLSATAVESGKITKPANCDDCYRGGKLHAHHHRGYDKPLEVEWLCSLCHNARHREREKAKEER